MSGGGGGGQLVHMSGGGWGGAASPRTTCPGGLLVQGDMWSSHNGPSRKHHCRKEI